MKSANAYRLLLVALVLALACVLLAACASPCSHDWVAGEYTLRPVCGEVSEGTRSYTCSLCGETKEEPVTNTATACTWDEGVLAKAPTCTESGSMTKTCTVCGNTTSVDVDSLGGHVWDLYAPDMVIDYEANKRFIPCAHEGCTHTVEKEAYVTYEMYGAVGDGVTDDFDEIKATHAYANEWGIDVWGTKNAKYYIGYSCTQAIVQTNVDWKNALFIIDDTTIPYDDSAASRSVVFLVTSKTPNKMIEFPEDMTLTKGQTNIGLTFDEPCMIRIMDENDRIFMRKGENPSDGSARQEMLLVDENGNVDPSTPIQYDYKQLTSIEAFSITDASITLKNGRFKTVTYDPRTKYPEYTNNYYFIDRGVLVRRSNTVLSDMIYVIEGEHTSESNNYDNRGLPYTGSFYFQDAYNVTFRDSKLQTHKAYSFFQEGNVRNEMGSYSLCAHSCINLSFIGLKQTNALTDRDYSHGIMVSHFCRNMLVEDCQIDRFDSHQGMYNATVKNSTLGFGCLVIGGGTLTLDNVERSTGTEFITLRYDFNSFFDGTVDIKNCVAGAPVTVLIGGSWKEGFFGLPQICVRKLYIDGLSIKSSMMNLFMISGVSEDVVTRPSDPFIMPELVKVQNITGVWRLSNRDVYLDRVPLEQ